MIRLLSLFLFVAISGYVQAGRRTTTGYGRVLCYGEPMPYVKVSLKDDDPFVDDTFANTRANSKGYFRVTGSAYDAFFNNPDPFIRVEYQYSGTYGKMEIEGLVFGKNHGGRTKTRKYKRYINFGNINFRSIRCRAYVRFYQAMKDFKIRAHRKLPVGTLHVRTGVLLHGGSAYATTNIIRIPKSYKTSQMTLRLAKHELAHTARHSMDGSVGHFLYDVARYGYMRSHHCGTKSNNGYAFNEGWAEYWAGSCYGNYGKSSRDYRYEGNVAKALRKLKANCKSSDARFVYILKTKRGKIHSFASFNNYHKSIYRCKI